MISSIGKILRSLIKCSVVIGTRGIIVHNTQNYVHLRIDSLNDQLAIIDIILI